MKRLTFILAAFILAACAAAKMSHPSLIFTPQRVAEAKRAVQADTAAAAGWRQILAEADRQLQGRGDIRKAEYPALAYLMTGDKRYADLTRDILLEAAHARSWENGEMMARRPAWRSELQMAHRAFQGAVAYDAVYNQLTPAERKEIAKGLWRVAGEPLTGDWVMEPARIHCLNSMGHNWFTSCAGMGGILAIALSEEIPEAARAARTIVEMLPEWFDFAGDVLQHKPRTFDRRGAGMYESINYASFGITQALLLRLAWLNSHPGQPLEDIPQMHRLGEFFAHVCYPRTGMLYSLNFGDSHKNVTGESAVMLARAMGAKVPELEWYLAQITPGQHREGYPQSTPLGLLYTPRGKEASTSPELPKSHIWPDFGWATMRSSWDKDATMLAVKSGMTWNHAHADANSMILFHKGVDIIKDAGNCSYGLPQYRGYFFQTEAHNVVKFNGKGQSTYQQYHGALLPGSVSAMIDGGAVKYVLADGTGPMSEHLRRNFRHFLWIDNVIYVIDDLSSHAPGQFEWLWHPGGEAKKQGYDLNVTNGDASVAIRPIYPRPLAYSGYVHDYPDDLWWETVEAPHESLKSTEEYWSFHLPAVTDRIKAVTAIILKDSVAQKELPRMERRDGKDWIGLRVTDKGRVTDIYINSLADGQLMHLNSWIEADGWVTDAYMLAVTYPEGTDPAKADRKFICHGSSLRRGEGDVYFSSLSKLNLLANESAGGLEVEVNGQPRINASVKSPAKRVRVNGKTAPTVRNGNMLKISLRNED